MRGTLRPQLSGHIVMWVYTDRGTARRHLAGHMAKPACTRTLALVVSLIVHVDALAQTFATTDSIVAHGLVYIGSVERTSYTLDEPVTATLLIANRSSTLVRLQATVECPPIALRELWNNPETGRYEVHVNPPWVECDNIGTLEIGPGEMIVRTAVIESAYPGPPHEFLTATVQFKNPWNVSPNFWFFLPYSRDETVAVESKSWSAIKSLYQ